MARREQDGCDRISRCSKQWEYIIQQLMRPTRNWPQQKTENNAAVSERITYFAGDVNVSEIYGGRSCTERRPDAKENNVDDR